MWKKSEQEFTLEKSISSLYPSEQKMHHGSKIVSTATQADVCSHYRPPHFILLPFPNSNKHLAITPLAIMPSADVSFFCQIFITQHRKAESMWRVCI
jgi:hypothetical protein